MAPGVHNENLLGAVRSACNTHVCDIHMYYYTLLTASNKLYHDFISLTVIILTLKIVTVYFKCSEKKVETEGKVQDKTEEEEKEADADPEEETSDEENIY